MFESLLPQFSDRVTIVPFLMTCFATCIFGIPFGRFLGYLTALVFKNKANQRKRLPMWMAAILVGMALLLPKFWGGLLSSLAIGILISYLFSEQFKEDWRAAMGESIDSPPYQ